jgi:hypothetical protein
MKAAPRPLSPLNPDPPRIDVARITLWGFSGSTYVRTVRMLLAEKGVSDYEQVPVDVLKVSRKARSTRRATPSARSRWSISTAFA